MVLRNNLGASCTGKEGYRERKRLHGTQAWFSGRERRTHASTVRCVYASPSRHGRLRGGRPHWVTRNESLGRPCLADEAYTTDETSTLTFHTTHCNVSSGKVSGGHRHEWLTNIDNGLLTDVKRLSSVHPFLPNSSWACRQTRAFHISGEPILLVECDLKVHDEANCAM